VRDIYRVIDWLLSLPREVNIQLRREVQTYLEEKKMKFVSSFEQLAKEEGRVEGERIGLLRGMGRLFTQRFGPLGDEMFQMVRQLDDINKLDRIQQALLEATTLADIQQLLDE